ncbi:MAG TPA: SGNH/GDSL hydrolase family protein [Armatimonadota bacterium]
MLLSANFEQDPLAAGWVAQAAEGQAAPSWTDAAGHTGKHCLTATSGQWQSPLFPVTPCAYYRLEFWSRAGTTENLYALYFYSAAGEQLEADHYSNVDASGDWLQHVVYIRAKGKATHARVIFQANGDQLLIDDVSVQAATHAEAATWAKQQIASIPPGHFKPAADRWANLPRTLHRLQEGGTLRVVMLGDSIINDTGSSPWDVLVEKADPKAHLEVITAVSGGKGCWYYREENRVQSYVLDYAPDLLIIGGISQKGDLAAIREVIAQVRAKANPEIVLMTGAFGKVTDPRTVPGGYTGEPDPDGPGYREGMRALASEEGAGFFDLRGAWAQYMLGVTEPMEWFHRDPVHANERGRAIAAQLLSGYFTP